MLVPEILSNIFYPEDNFQAYLRGVSLLIDEMRLDLTSISLDNTKSQERLQNQLNSMIAQYQICKL